MKRDTHIDRRILVTRHDPVLTEIDIHSPLSIGNGDFAFTADATGFQTLYDEYGEFMPLCTMAQWGWHSVPNAEGGYYTADDAVMEEFDFVDRKVRYALNMQKGNEEPYTWLRKNPHRCNLARITLLLDGREITARQISDISQRLHLYDGYLQSDYSIDGLPCRVLSACDPENDVLLFIVESAAVMSGRLSVRVAFPYGDHHKAGGLWDCPEKHATALAEQTQSSVLLNRQMDADRYCVYIKADECDMAFVLQAENHIMNLSARNAGYMRFTVSFATNSTAIKHSADDVFKRSREWWNEFWERGAAVRLSKSTHPKAFELERRIVLSQYLLALQCAGSMPPAETGLTCNSWYGKFHLEMHLWHAAYLPLWNHGELLEKSLAWYRNILPKARWNASRNGFKGARWPKMVGPEGVDSPSFIATLLIWQQPHILYMLALMFDARGGDLDFLRENWEIIRDTADFMADFPVFNAETGRFDLIAPLIPSEEQYSPMDVRNPGFELVYWRFGLKLAIEFAEKLGEQPNAKWFEVRELISPPPMRDGKYMPHEWHREDMKQSRYVPVGMIGLLPGEDVSKEAMARALSEFMLVENKFMIGWVFAYFAMCATRLNMRNEAIELLLMDHPCNVYFASGNNCQGVPSDLPDLPLYLPGNGGLLLAIALMAAGYPGSAEAPGFPDDGSWVVETDGLRALPF